MKWIAPRGRGKTFWRSVDACRKKVKDGQFYLIKRHGAWFCPNAQGYTGELSLAGVFDAATTRDYLDVDGISVIPVSAVKEEISGMISRLESQVSTLRHMAERTA